MNKLESFYQSLDRMADFMTEEELAKKEEQLLQEELTSAVSHSVAQLLTGVRRPIAITIDYEPQGDIVVKVSRKRSTGAPTVEQRTITAKEPSPNIETEGINGTLFAPNIKRQKSKKSLSIGETLCFLGGAWRIRTAVDGFADR